MTQSMTAFARQELQADWGDLSLELRSVNHRHLEISLRLPEELRNVEPLIRERIGKQLSRGKIDFNIRFQSSSAQPEKLELNRELATHLAQLSREVDGLLYDAAPASSLELLKWPGVLQAAASDTSEQLQAGTLQLLDSALTELIETRLREGKQLQVAIEKRVDAMVETCAEVRQLLPRIKQDFRERLAGRLAEIKAELDANRVEQEIVLFAQKIDVDEELDRLDAHFIEVRRVLSQDKPMGRRLDFLMQELNREANTLASKSAAAETTRAAVELKVLIEQMREQVQNIE